MDLEKKPFRNNKFSIGHTFVDLENKNLMLFVILPTFKKNTDYL